MAQDNSFTPENSLDAFGAEYQVHFVSSEASFKSHALLAIAAAGRDYVVVRDTTTNYNYLLWTVYLNYVEFREDITVR